MGQLLAMQLNVKECLAAHICIRPRAIGDAAGGRQAEPAYSRIAENAAARRSKRLDHWKKSW